MTDQGSKKSPSIPDWQQAFKQSQQQNPPTSSDDQPASEQSTAELPLLEQAQKFLEEESIRNAPRERKVAFLEQKGVQADDIEKLLGPGETSTAPTSHEATDMKTVHDSSEAPSERDQELRPESSQSGESTSFATVAPKRDIPPIITYPEFLLKPQKPPPLVTFERLANAAYVLAGISALTYGASKYIVQPMLETLTDARHELAETAKVDLQTLNTKLESTVSHVPYIASSAILQRKKELEDDEMESIDSDPTELFHRDVATQTSPPQERSMSFSSTEGLPAQDPTTSQASRLRSLHSTLSSLLTSTTTHFSQDRLKEQMSEFQGVLDKLEGSYNPFQIDYGGSILSYSTAGTGTGDEKDKSKSKKAADTEATKFKNEIRALKGAFLSSRNFPTARPAAPFALPSR